MLTRLVSASVKVDEESQDRLSLLLVLRRTLQTCITRRDMGTWEVIHLVLHTPSVHHDLEFAIASTQSTSQEVVGGPE